VSTSNYEMESQYQKINRFFIDQVRQLESPIIDAMPNCVTVGPYRVVTNGKFFEVWKGRLLIGNFLKRSWGVAYALCLYRGNASIAKQLVSFNYEYERLSEDRGVYKHHIQVNKKRKNSEREVNLKNRLSRVDSELISLSCRCDTILKSLHI
jgi:hypothetical protein